VIPTAFDGEDVAELENSPEGHGSDRATGMILRDMRDGKSPFGSSDTFAPGRTAT
jgi:hypothetical protein